MVTEKWATNMIAIDWATQVITIPRSDLTLLSGVVYELDVNWLRLQFKDLEDSPEGMAFPDIHRHVAPITLSGVTYSRFVEIINGYTITFEDVGSHYTVNCTGANHNLADVTNFDTVNLVVNNSAGLIVTSGGSGGLTTEQDAQLMKTLTVGKFIALK